MPHYSKTMEIISHDNNFQPGDIIYVNRQGGLYKHFGVYIGNGNVAHFAPDNADELNAQTADVRIATLTAFSSGDNIHIDTIGKPQYAREEIVHRALSKIGQLQGRYNIIFNNCEHFARWCQTGHSESRQVNNAITCMFDIFKSFKLI